MQLVGQGWLPMVVLPLVGRADALFALNGVTYLIFAAALSLIRGLPPREEDAAPLAGSLAEGVRFVWGQATLRALLVMITIVGVFGRSYVALLPVFARDMSASMQLAAPNALRGRGHHRGRSAAGPLGRTIGRIE